MSTNKITELRSAKSEQQRRDQCRPLWSNVKGLEAEDNKFCLFFFNFLPPVSQIGPKGIQSHIRNTIPIRQRVS